MALKGALKGGLISLSIYLIIMVAVNVLMQMRSDAQSVAVPVREATLGDARSVSGAPTRYDPSAGINRIRSSSSSSVQSYGTLSSNMDELMVIKAELVRLESKLLELELIVAMLMLAQEKMNEQ